jgi:excisionase family DNA binding protein
MFITTSEAARLVNRTPDTILRWVSEGKVSASRPGPRCVLVDKKDVVREAKRIRPGRKAGQKYNLTSASDRNADLVKLRLAGESAVSLSLKFRISRARVYQILSKFRDASEE